MLNFLINPGCYPALLIFCIISQEPALLLAQPFGGGPPPPDRIFDFMDRNKDGKLTADETERMPGNVKDLLRERNIDLERGISRDKFIEIAPKLFEESRARREEEERKNSEERSKDNNSSSNSSSSSKKEAPKSSNVWVPPKKERVTMELSKNYSSLDTDGDDQLGLYEWRSANKGSSAEFELMDLDQDGFLTPMEITYYETKAKKLTNSSSKTTVSSSFANTNTPATTLTDKSAVSKEISKMEKKAEKQEAKESNESAEKKNEKLDAEALYLVGVLDKNKDDIINPSEWAVSKKLKPAFEQAGIDISKDMSKDDFITNYRNVGNGWRK